MFEIATGCALAMTEGLDSRLRGNEKSFFLVISKERSD